ncbi:hypothetical protein AB0M02_07520 [Actinoplanes sp. NPDC051861]|uniref:hypothetical protein n=1 Tax=Actinoplanes sp. NPDC051861 TaxID=3155170 RepID=UPI00342E87D2
MTQLPPPHGMITMYPPGRRRFRPRWMWLGLGVAGACAGAVTLVVATGSPDTTPVVDVVAVPVVAVASASSEPEVSESPAEPEATSPSQSRVVTPTASTKPPRAVPKPKPKPTSTPTPTRYQATPAEIYAAEVAVEEAEHEYVVMQNNPSGWTGEADLAVQQYRIDRLKQDLADLRAGTPGKQHRKLDIREAKVYLAQAKARFEWISGNPSYSDLERQQAWADVLKWTERLQEVQS